MYIVLEGSDEGENHPFVRLVTREELQQELDEQLVQEGIAHEYLSEFPRIGLAIGERLVLECKPVVPVVERVITKVRIP
jgi:hypothetical protein